MARAAELVDRTVRERSSQLEPSLQQFSDPAFDPADYLNDILPPLTIHPSSIHQNSADDRSSGSLANVSAQTQSLISQLSAQNARLSNTLTQLTDEIVRGGGRLAYEVEILRGETIGLSDAISETLQDDIRRFLPEGLPGDKQGEDSSDAREEDVDNKTVTGDEDDTSPEFVRRLRTLSVVRSRLDDVVRIFGEAMEWPLAPSEVSIASSFISVSAPEHSLSDQSLEDKGRAVEKKLRHEVIELLDSEGGGEAGLAAASKRVESLRLLADVWKGTAEEKARVKIAENLAKLVDDRRRVLESQREKEAKELRRAVGSSPSKTASPSPAAQGSSGGGLLRNLQRLRDEIYLD